MFWYQDTLFELFILLERRPFDTNIYKLSYNSYDIFRFARIYEFWFNH